MSGFYSFHCGCFCLRFKTLILGIINVLPIIRITILRIMSLFFNVYDNV